MPATTRLRSEPTANRLLAERHEEARRWQRVLQGNSVHATGRGRPGHLAASALRAALKLTVLALAILAWLGHTGGGL
jgi:hypothetical protein